ncbi:hybrid sensor histidine kinase/response regulator [Roseateles amylovorans]|uniref:Response regulator n=1 Tax=Roseateles amylovorans TaxID=2978473 RepID=A0ABY6B4F3_9BURK|nr:hybrid sensor histidine kinase/response regulator [Roseateles amylovorans]UXH78829.1 response regulator [Roseateles amylovorans]
MVERLRVLLVEDDASLQRFVAMALEDEPVQLQVCRSVDEALRSLAAQPYDLIVTDLMLPGRSGLDLLQLLKERPELRGDASLAAFSAGLTAPVRPQLEALGVTRFLSKPCSLADLHACIREVQQALAPHAARSADDRASTVESPARHSTLDPSAMDQYFGGNVALYEAFLARCRTQFRVDIDTGRRSVAEDAPQAMRHLAHSLKSVLLTLGHPEAADVARQLEHDAAIAVEQRAISDAVRDGWARLEVALAGLL